MAGLPKMKSNLCITANVWKIPTNLRIKRIHNTEPVCTFCRILVHSLDSQIANVYDCLLSQIVQGKTSLQQQFLQPDIVHAMDADVPHGQVNLQIK